MSTTTPKSILVIGIKQDPTPDQRWSGPEVRKAVQAEAANAKSQGYDMTTYLIDVEDEHALDGARDLLTGRSWDGVMIGFGVRGDANLSGLFTDLVNAVAVGVSGVVPRFMFPLRPDRLVEVMDREFGGRS